MERVQCGSGAPRPLGAAAARGAACRLQDTGPKRLPCSTSPMVVPEAAVDIVAGAVVCLPTVSTS